MNTVSTEKAAIEAAARRLFRFGGSHERPRIFLDWALTVKPPHDLFWRFLQLEWSGFDAIPHKEYAKLLQSYGTKVKRGGWTRERADDDPWHDLPDTFEIYRGQSGLHQMGLSWTRDYDTAAMFAHGHRGLRRKVPAIEIMTITKAKVCMVHDDRDESEIVLWRIPTFAQISGEHGIDHGVLDVADAAFERRKQKRLGERAAEEAAKAEAAA